MKLVEIDVVDAQPPKRSVAFPLNRIRLENASRRSHRIVLIPDQSTFGEDHWPFGRLPFAQQAADHFLGVPKSVHCGRIDPVHPEFQGVAHGCERNGVVLRSPAEGPAAAADRPGAKSGFRDQDSARAEGSLRKAHDSILWLNSTRDSGYPLIGGEPPRYINAA
jgi:hypothetical protein